MDEQVTIEELLNNFWDTATKEYYKMSTDPSGLIEYFDRKQTVIKNYHRFILKTVELGEVIE